MISMSDEGGVETVISSTGMEKEVPMLGGQEPQPSQMYESLESMAMMSQAPSSSNTFATAGPQCRGCGSPVSPTERFCPHCGLDL